MSEGSDGKVLGEVRRISKALFGSRYRLETASAIASGGDVLYAREIAERLTVGDNQAQLELRHFETAGLLVRLDRVIGQRQQYYERRPSHFWVLAQLMHEELLAKLSREAGSA